MNNEIRGFTYRELPSTHTGDLKNPNSEKNNSEHLNPNQITQALNSENPRQFTELYYITGSSLKKDQLFKEIERSSELDTTVNNLFSLRTELNDVLKSFSSTNQECLETINKVDQFLSLIVNKITSSITNDSLVALRSYSSEINLQDVSGKINELFQKRQALIAIISELEENGIDGRRINVTLPPETIKSIQERIVLVNQFIEKIKILISDNLPEREEETLNIEEVKEVGPQNTLPDSDSPENLRLIDSIKTSIETDRADIQAYFIMLNEFIAKINFINSQGSDYNFDFDIRQLQQFHERVNIGNLKESIYNIRSKYINFLVELQKLNNSSTTKELLNQLNDIILKMDLKPLTDAKRSITSNIKIPLKVRNQVLDIIK